MTLWRQQRLMQSWKKIRKRRQTTERPDKSSLLKFSGNSVQAVDGMMGPEEYKSQMEFCGAHSHDVHKMSTTFFSDCAKIVNSRSYLGIFKRLTLDFKTQSN
ncbi:uncharacterized protein LOC117178867 [Belonocnema kinseyi]|uniref:uncharacterized protein LOC117178867 n=1 Tax=Belonocnema kinseyi TaxID=2817044 RepID=UPI00143DD166|nr:uncharacterized protein LOC117178867 [Belonocnema kinseyi]